MVAGTLVLSVGTFGALFGQSEESRKAPLESSLAPPAQFMVAEAEEARSRELMEVLNERMKQAEEKERRAQEAEERMELIKADLSRRIEEMRKEREKLAEVIKAKADKEDANLVLLAKSFAETPPEQAGIILGELEADLAGQILRRMNKRKAGKIWGYIDSNKAAAISRALADRPGRGKAKRPPKRRPRPELLPPPMPLE